ncbi:MAG: cytochrome ubiquinol oxidase subunit I [Bacteroidales bacterium]|jgi:cytochrome d ubiquinol oxidase subunit I|nr:cytochrome ubiquinol oxidase subunit I [Bacteroidales bacterium]
MDISLIDWSRAQFALTAFYHWLFVPLTLGLAFIMAVMETLYVRTGKSFWRDTAKFWMKLFGINFAVGIATGLILEFQFGTNWSNYSWFVGDIFGAPLAIEGIVAFFMEATFVAVMFFGWNKVSKRFHLVSTWLTCLGATISAWWILVANAWMQYPVGMAFNPDTVRNEMVSFLEVATSPMAVAKFFHTVLSGWVLASAFVLCVASWYLVKKRESKFALSSIKIAAITGLFASVLSFLTGDMSARMVAKTQPMKLAAMEGLYNGGNGVGLVAIGMVNPNKQPGDSQEAMLFDVKIPKMLSFLASHDLNSYVPGINDILDGGYPMPDGSVALSFADKKARGTLAHEALADYRQAKEAKNPALMQQAQETLAKNMPYFGYAYFNDSKELVPNVPLNFYAFRVMVILGGYFILLFFIAMFLSVKEKYHLQKWVQWVALLSLPLAYIAGMSGWVVAECGRQPWAIQDLLPVKTAISKLQPGDVQLTFWLFLALFTLLLIAEIGIMLKAIKKGPELKS